jgi:hypothetical protein
MGKVIKIKNELYYVDEFGTEKICKCKTPVKTEGYSFCEKCDGQIPEYIQKEIDEFFKKKNKLNK